MSDAPEKLHGEVLALWRRILGADALQVLLFGLCCAFAAGYVNHAFAADIVKGIDAGVAPVTKELAEHKREELVRYEALARAQESTTKRVENVERLSIEMAFNVKMIAESMKLRPITLAPQPLDGGP